MAFLFSISFTQTTNMGLISDFLLALFPTFNLIIKPCLGDWLPASWRSHSSRPLLHSITTHKQAFILSHLDY